MATIYKSNSNYHNTKQTYKYLDLYDPKLTIDTLSSVTYEIEVKNKYDRRPDLLAFDLYDDAALWWVIVHYNRDKLKDPINDFRAGITIVVPERYNQ